MLRPLGEAYATTKGKSPNHRLTNTAHRGKLATVPCGVIVLYVCTCVE